MVNMSTGMRWAARAALSAEAVDAKGKRSHVRENGLRQVEDEEPLGDVLDGPEGLGLCRSDTGEQPMIAGPSASAHQGEERRRPWTRSSLAPAATDS